MITDKMLDLLNKQANREHYSAFLYLQMALYFKRLNWHGFASYFMKAYEEELVHMNKLFDEICDRGGNAVILPMEEIKTNWNNIQEIFITAFEHEKKVTRWLIEIKKAAQAEGDHTTDTLLDWFIREQVEEENRSEEATSKVAKISSLADMILMDNELGK